MKHRKLFTSALAATLLVGSFAAANAAVTFDAETGEGFVGKGDVQTALNYNNKQLQDNAGSLRFSVNSTTETTWECANNNNENIKERSRSTTTTGVVSSVARERNQITGFHLTGYNGSVTTVTEGLAVNTCPGDAGQGNGNDPWTYVEGSTVTDSDGSSSGIFVNGVALD